MEKHPNDCRHCLEARRIVPKCALCRTEYNYGEDHGGKWCSEYCRFSSTYLRRNLAGVLVVKSQELYEAFYRDWSQNWDIKTEDIPKSPFHVRGDLLIRRKGQDKEEGYQAVEITKEGKALRAPKRSWVRRGAPVQYVLV